MKIISTLRKRQQQAVDVWNFCYESETDTYFATNGSRVYRAQSSAHLYNMRQKFCRSGYRTEIAPAKVAKPVRKPAVKQMIADPWSDIPADMQLELWALK